jgi:hypothetical protein
MPNKLRELTVVPHEELLSDISFLSPEQQDRYSELADNLAGRRHLCPSEVKQTLRSIIVGGIPNVIVRLFWISPQTKSFSHRTKIQK